MSASYTIDGVAKHMLTMERSYTHASDSKANLQALYVEVRKVFPSLTSHDFIAAFDRCLEMRRAAGNRTAE